MGDTEQNDFEYICTVEGREMLEAAIRVLRKNGENVSLSPTFVIVNGIAETPKDVISYADDLYKAEKNKPLHVRAEKYGKPRKGAA